MSLSEQVTRPSRAVTLLEFIQGRKRIRVGTMIRTRISRSSGPVYKRIAPQGESGVFLVREIWSIKIGRTVRVYLEADGVDTARAVTLYISGPRYRSPAPSTWMYPYSFSVKQQHVKRSRKTGSRQAPRAAARRARPAADGQPS